MEKTKKIRVGAIVGNVLFVLLLTAMLGGALVFALSANTEKSLFGYRFYAAMSDSMHPEIERGDMLLVRMTAHTQANPGDIITYAASDEGDVTVTHRLVRQYENEAGQTMMVTKGDANDREDSPVPAARMIGVVTDSLPYMGTAAGFIRQNLLLVLFNLAVLIAAVLGIRHLLRGRKHTGSHHSQPMMED